MGGRFRGREALLLRLKIDCLPGKLLAALFILLIFWLPAGAFADSELKFRWDSNEAKYPSDEDEDALYRSVGSFTDANSSGAGCFIKSVSE